MAGEGMSGSAERQVQARQSGYQGTMVAVTSLVISFLAMDRLATGYIGPFLIADLDLSITQLGALYSGQALAVAISGVAIGRFSDRTGMRKRLLIPLLLLCTIVALSTWLADDYLQLMVVRIAMGVALGGLTPIIQSIVSVQSTPGRLGMHIGIQTLLMFLIAQMGGPLVTTRLANAFGWQTTYAASAVPFLVLAVLVSLLVRENPPVERNQDGSMAVAPAASADAKLTISLCLAISMGFMLWLVIHSTFLSLYLVEVHGFEPTRAGEILSVLGIAGAAGGLFLPMVSDRVGSERTLFGGMVVSAIVPLALLFWTGPAWGLQLFLFLGWLSVGALPIYAVLIPGKTVPPAQLAATIALIVGLGEVVGGIGGPILAGQLADRFGMTVPFVFTLGTAVACIALSLALCMVRKKRAE